MKHNKAHFKLLPLLLAGLFSSQSHAAGFALIENSASGLGNAFAGGAAVSEDASVVWFNPAAMSELQGRNVSAAIHLIKTSNKFSDNGSTAPSNLGNNNTGGDAGGLHAVPNLYLTLPINNQWSFGIGLNAPFGLTTEYNSDWVGRFQGIKSELTTFNINPALSWKANDMVSLGFGLNVQRIDAELTNLYNVGAAGLTSNLKITGDDTGYGYNLGILIKPTSSTQIGMHYRSSIKYVVQGRAEFSGVAASSSGDVKSDIKMPAMFSLSGLQHLNDRWDLMGDLTWTQWSNIPELRFVRTSGASAGSTLGVTPYNWKNTWRASVGGTYKLQDNLKLRMGIAYDQSPVPDANRTVRLPDEDRYWLSFGAQYAMQKNLKLDFGYTFLKSRTASISQNGLTSGAGSTGNIVGSYENNVHILSAQINYQF